MCRTNSCGFSSGCFQAIELIVQSIQLQADVLQHAGDRRAIVAFQMKFISRFNQSVAGQIFIAEHEFHDGAHILQAGRPQNNRSLNRAGDDTDGIVQHQLIHPLRKLNRQGRRDPAAHRIADQRYSRQSQSLQKELQHLDKSRDAIVDERLARSAKAQQIRSIHAMGLAERFQAIGPHIRPGAQSVDQKQRLALAVVVVLDGWPNT